MEEESTEKKTKLKEEDSDGDEDERSEQAADLLEEFWFFGNLLQRNQTLMMKRCFSDPCPSSSSNNNNNQEMTSFKGPTVSPPKLAGAPAGLIMKSTEPKETTWGSCGRVLHRTPSLPPCLGKEEEAIEEHQSGSRSHPRCNKGTLNHVTRGMEKSEPNKEFPTSKEKLVKKFDKRSSSSSKKLNRSPQGSRIERSDPNRVDSVVVDEDGPSMDQVYQLMLGKSGPSSSHTQDTEPSNPWKSPKSGKPSPQALIRAPSLPPSLGRGEVIEEQRGSQSHPRLSKSNRQASLNLSEILPPRRSSKGVPNYLSTDKEMKRRILNRTKSMRSRGELESEEVQGFKDLGFTFDRKDLNPNLVNILPGLQEKKNQEEQEEEAADKQGKEEVKKGPYLSESWLSHNFAPPIPKWTPKGGAGGSPDDLKAHIKFWARAVASNVGQEC